MRKTNLLIGILTALAITVTAFVNPAQEQKPIKGNVLITATYHIDITDVNGRTVTDYERESDSYVIAFADLLYVHMAADSLTITDTGGTGRSISANALNFKCNNSGTTTVFGIVFGTGTNAVALTDTSLQTLIANGTGAGQLSYQGMSYVAPQTTGTTRYFTFTRSAKNNTASTITVNECGIYGDASGTPYYFCLIRDVVAGGQAVLSTQTITLTYTISITV